MLRVRIVCDKFGSIIGQTDLLKKDILTVVKTKLQRSKECRCHFLRYTTLRQHGLTHAKKSVHLKFKIMLRFLQPPQNEV